LIPLKRFACLASFALLPIVAIAQTQERTPASIVDGVVEAVCQKQIVMLGEPPSHWEAMAFDAKSQIVDRLIAQCGFTAILFEAPIYDFVGFDRAVKAQAPTPDQLDDAIGRFWLTRELAPWRRSLFDAASRRRVTIGGLDDQISITSRYAQSTLPTLIAAASSKPDCAETVARHLKYTYDAAHPFDDTEKRSLQACARRASSAATGRFEPAERAMLDSFVRYADRQIPNAPLDRDASMFRNLVWYIDQLPANARVVVWTATVHAARKQGALAEVPLGQRVAERWGDRAAAVGFTAYGGTTSRAARPATAISDAPTESLEAAATKTSAWTLLNSAELRAAGTISSRLLGKFLSENWADFFDAVIVVRREVAPAFDPWK